MLNSSKQIRTGALISYFAIIFNMLAGLIYTPWMISQIGQNNYGLYTLANSLITIFVMDFGMGSAVSRFVSKYRAENNQKAINDFLGLTYKLYIALDGIILVVFLVLSFFINRIYANLTIDELATFKSLYLIVGLFSIISFPFTNLNGILTAYEKFVNLKLADLFHKVFIIVAMVFALYMGYGVFALVTVNALSGILTILIKLLILRSKTDVKVNLKFKDNKLLKQIFGFSMWTTIKSFAQRIMFNISPSIIAAMVGSVEVAFFSLATTIEGYVFTFANAINGMFLPKISRILVGENSDEKLNKLLVKVAKFHVYTIGFVILCILALGQNFVQLWLGDGYQKVYYCAILIIFPSLIELPQQIAKTALLAKEVVKPQAIIYVVMVVLTVIISFITVPVFGAIGASAAIFISYIFRTVAENFLYKKYLNINIGEYFKNMYFKWSFSAILVLLVGFGLNSIFKDVNFITFVASVCIMAIVYFITLFFTDIEKNDRILLLKKFKILK